MVLYDKYCFKLKQKPKYLKKEKNTAYFVKRKQIRKTKGVALENKIHQQKSICAGCESKKSTFLKQVKNKK